MSDWVDMLFHLLLLLFKATADLEAEQQFGLQNFILKLKQLKYLEMSAFPPSSYWSALCCKSMFAPIPGLWFWSVMCTHTHTYKLRSVTQRMPWSFSQRILAAADESVFRLLLRVSWCHHKSPAAGLWTFALRIVLSFQNKRLYFVSYLFILEFVCHSSVDYPTAAATRKTPTLALCCLRIGLYCIVPGFNQILQHLPPLLYEDSTMLSCPPFPPHPFGEKPERGRAWSTVSGRRRGTPPANGRPCCPGRAQVLGQTKGSVRRRK